MADWWENLKAATGGTKKKASSPKGKRPAPPKDEGADLSIMGAAKRLKGRKAQIDQAIDDLGQ